MISLKIHILNKDTQKQVLQFMSDDNKASTATSPLEQQLELQQQQGENQRRKVRCFMSHKDDEVQYWEPHGWVNDSRDTAYWDDDI